MSEKVKKYKAIASVNDDLTQSDFKTLDEKQDDIAIGKSKNKSLIEYHQIHSSASLIGRVAKMLGYELAIAKKQYSNIDTANQLIIDKNQRITKFTTLDLRLQKSLSKFGQRAILLLPVIIKNERYIKSFDGQLEDTLTYDVNDDVETGYMLVRTNFLYGNIKYNVYYKLDGINKTITMFANNVVNDPKIMTDNSVSASALGLSDTDIIDYTSYCPENERPWMIWYNNEDGLPDLFEQIGYLNTLNELWDDVLPNWTRIRDNFRSHKIYGGKAEQLALDIRKKDGVSDTKTVQNKYVSDVSIVAGTDKTNSLLMKIKEIEQQALADALIDTINIKSNNKHNQGEHREMRPSKIKILALKILRELDYTIYFQKLISCLKIIGLIDKTFKEDDVVITLDIPLNLYETEQLLENQAAQESIRVEEAGE